MHPATLPMTDSPNGNCANIPDDLSDTARDIEMFSQFAVHLVGSAARIAGSWMGVSVQATCFSLGYATELSMHFEPSTWLLVHQNLPIVCDLRRAEIAGWITIEKGYAFPTQQLADLVCISS